MTIVKRIALVILLLIGVALIAALFVKKEMGAEREIVINKPKEEVYSYIKNLKNQNHYSKWAGMDTAMKKEYRGTDGTVGFVSAWESTNGEVGKGEQTITKMEEGKRIDYDLHFIQPFESKATTYMVTEEVAPNKTKVKWGFAGKMNYPFNLMGLFINMDKNIGDDFYTGLTNLKNILEKSDGISQR